MCGAGVITLAGIIVNNNIILIDCYTILRQEGHNVYNAILLASAQRMRPILLTAVTTIVGLIPVVFGIMIDVMNLSFSVGSSTSQWCQSISLTIVSGMIFGTILTLFITPALLMLEKDTKR